MRHHFKHILICVSLVGLFICHYYGVTRYAHSHVINGAVVYHSHYSDTDNTTTQHSHTTHEVMFLSMLSDFHVETPSLQSIPDIIIIEYFAYFQQPKTERIRQIITCFSGRAPPIV